jgi:hypothetical protein
MAFVIVIDENLPFFFRKAGRLVSSGKRTLEAEFRNGALLFIFLQEQVRVEDNTQDWIAKQSKEYFESVFQIDSIKKYVKKTLWYHTPKFSWDAAFAKVIYPAIFNCGKVPLMQLNKTEEFFEIFFEANYAEIAEDDASNVFVYAYGDGDIDITKIINVSKEQRMSFATALYTFVSRMRAEQAVRSLRTKYNSNHYFDSTIGSGKEHIRKQIDKFNDDPDQNWFKVQESTYDLGLFVKNSFTVEEDHIFMEYTGLLIPNDIATKLPYRYDKLFALKKQDVTVAPEICRFDGDQFNFFCYANDPGYNTEKKANIAFVEKKGKVFIQALKTKYVAGEEFLLEYGVDYWRYSVSYWGGPEQRRAALGLDYWVDLRKDNVAEVIRKANAAGGPQIVLEENEELGYGLQADKDYVAGEFVTTYGGVLVAEDEDEDADAKYYAVTIETDKKKKEYVILDVEFRFDYRDKGRWVNEHPSNVVREYDNVNLKTDRDEEPETAYFYATKKVKKGEFFYWNYGPKYKRFWRKN